VVADQPPPVAVAGDVKACRSESRTSRKDSGTESCGDDEDERSGRHDDGSRKDDKPDKGNGDKADGDKSDKGDREKSDKRDGDDGDDDKDDDVVGGVVLVPLGLGSFLTWNRAAETRGRGRHWLRRRRRAR
jgi:hypothetical protein